MGFSLLETPVSDLGELVVQHRPSLRGLVVATIMVVMVTVAIGAFLVASAPNMLVIVIGIPVFTALLFLFPYHVWKMAHRRWLVYEQGMIERNGNHDEVYRWGEVTEVTSLLRTAKGVTTLDFRLKRQDGKTLKIRSSPVQPPSDEEIAPGAEVDALVLANLIEVLSLEKIIERGVAQYRRDDPVDFKKFRISPQGFHVGTQTLPWGQLEDIEGTAEVLLVRERGRAKPRWTLWIIDIPNHTAFPEILLQTQPRSFSLFANVENLPLAEPSDTVKSAYRTRFGLSLLASLALCVVSIVAGAGPALYQNYYSTQSRLDRAVTYIEQERYEEALTELNQAAQQSPERAVIYANRCIVYRETGNYEAAIRDCEQSLILRPHYDYAHVNLGLVYYRQEQYERAIAEYNAALASDSRYAYAYCSRAYTYKRTGETQEAIADFTTCLSLTQNAWWSAEATQQLEELRGLISPQ